jgi:hypothetical protein
LDYVYNISINYRYTHIDKEASMKLPSKPMQVSKELGHVKSGQACPLPAKGALGSAILTIVI